jgi:lactoylglutathione lyase
MFSMSILASVIQSNRLPFAPPRAVADLVLVGHKGGHTIMTKIKSFTVGLPVTELKRAVDWYRQLLGEVEEVNPAPGVWEFQIVPSGWLQLFESEINEPNQSVMRFESHDIEASRMLASSLSINVDQIETVPEAVRYFEFGDPFGNRLSFYELLA